MAISLNDDGTLISIGSETEDSDGTGVIASVDITDNSKADSGAVYLYSISSPVSLIRTTMMIMPT